MRLTPPQIWRLTRAGLTNPTKPNPGLFKRMYERQEQIKKESAPSILRQSPQRQSQIV